jgi:hypothetical protein
MQVYLMNPCALCMIPTVSPCSPDMNMINMSQSYIASLSHVLMFIGFIVT